MNCLKIARAGTRCALSMNKMRCRVVLPAFVLAFAVACGDDATPTTPPATQPAPLNVAGTWSGSLVIEGTTARMTWTLTQSGASVTGPVLVALPSGTVLANAALSGTVTTSTLTYTIAVPPGGIPAQPSCSGQAGGSATATIAVSSTLAGSYALISATC